MPQRNAASSKHPPDELRCTKFTYECIGFSLCLCTYSVYVTEKKTHTHTRTYIHARAQVSAVIMLFLCLFPCLYFISLPHFSSRFSCIRIQRYVGDNSSWSTRHCPFFVRSLFTLYKDTIGGRDVIFLMISSTPAPLQRDRSRKQ